MGDLEGPAPLAVRANAMPIPDQDARLLRRAPDLQHGIPVEDDVLVERVGLSGLDDERSRTSGRCGAKPGEREGEDDNQVAEVHDGSQDLQLEVLGAGTGWRYGL